MQALLSVGSFLLCGFCGVCVLVASSSCCSCVACCFCSGERSLDIEGVPLLVKSVFVMVTILALSSQSSFFHTSFIPAFFLIFLPLMTGKDKTAKSGKSKKALEAEFLAALQVYLSLYTF